MSPRRLALPWCHWRKSVELPPAHLFIVFHSQALIDRHAVGRQGTDHVFYPVSPRVRLTPMRHAKADAPSLDHVSIVVRPVPVIVLEYKLVGITIGEILL